MLLLIAIQERKLRLGGEELSSEEESFSGPQSNFYISLDSYKYRLDISRYASGNKFVSLNTDLISSSNNQTYISHFFSF